jgi:hypothetical protein
VLSKTRYTIDYSLLISCLPYRNSRISLWCKLLVRSSDIFKLKKISYQSEMLLRDQKSRQAALRGKFLPPSNTVRALLTACVWPRWCTLRTQQYWGPEERHLVICVPCVFTIPTHPNMCEPWFCIRRKKLRFSMHFACFGGNPTETAERMWFKVS